MLYNTAMNVKQRRFIVKIQLSILTNYDARRVLIYDEDRSLQLEFNCPEWLFKKVHGDLKSYWLVQTQIDSFPLHLIRQVAEQDW